MSSFQEFKDMAPAANRQGMEILSEELWNNLRCEGARVGYGDDVLSAGHPIWTFSTSMGSASVGFVTNKKTERVSLDAFFSEQTSTAVFCERVYRGCRRIDGTPFLDEFSVPKVRTLARFLSGGLVASCGVGSIEEAK